LNEQIARWRFIMLTNAFFFSLILAAAGFFENKYDAGQMDRVNFWLDRLLAFSVRREGGNKIVKWSAHVIGVCIRQYIGDPTTHRVDN
jgi:hypothetical protein